MNFYTVASRIRKQIKKDVQVAKDAATQLFGWDSPAYHEHVARATQTATDIQMHEFNETVELGLQLMETFKERVAERAVPSGERAMMLTVRPAEGTDWATFKGTTEQFVGKWADAWNWFEYAFEQKGETRDDMGRGFHVHIVFSTSKKNYYKSHVLRDAKRSWSYVADNCIQVDVIKNLERARAYIRGDKNDASKVAAVEVDALWRDSVNLPMLEAGGQVQPPALKH